MPNISYAITTHNEGECIEKLISFIIENKQDQDEIVVVDDYSTDPVTKAILEEHEAMHHIKLFKRELNKDFAAQKNFLTEKCNNEWIFNIDADEMPDAALIDMLPEIIAINRNVDCIAVPRSNIVNGITDEHIQKWGWSKDDKNRINWPDYQLRIYKRSPKIKWVGTVHERPSGWDIISSIPMDEEDLCLHHVKDISKQEKQNNYYNTF